MPEDVAVETTETIEATETAPETAPESTPETTLLTAATPPAMVNHDGTFADTWLDSLPENLRAEECLGKDVVPDFQNMVKQFVNQRKAIGKEKIVVPNEKSTPEEWAEFHAAGGRPDTAGDYKVEIPEEMKDVFTDASMADAKKMAHELGISQGQFEGYMNHQFAQAAATQTEQARIEKENKDGAEAELRTEFGGAYDTRMAAANRVIAEAIPDAEKQALFLQKFGNEPDFVRFASTVGLRLVEHSALKAALTQDAPGDAVKKISSLEQTKGYMDTSSEDMTREERQSITDEILRLRRIQYPE